jgi:hypothetical protein
MPFCGTENESAMEHMNELSTLSNLFSDDIKLHTYFVAKSFPFSLKDGAKTWFNSLSPGSIHSPIALVNAFFQKYFLLVLNMLMCRKSLTLNREKERYCLNLGQGFVL